jgi:cytochrome c1
MSSLALFAVAALKLTLAQDPAAGVDARDNGPSTIDVSGWPAEQKARYALFQQKCSKCHAIGRSVNSRFTAAEWKRYMKRMVRRPNAGTTDEQAEDIFEFLKYYASKQGL